MEFLMENKPKKFDNGKPRMDLIRPEFTEAMGKALGFGADKYSEQRGEIPNYLKGEGFHYSKIIASLERHFNSFKKGVDIDEESGIEHIVLVAVNAMFLHSYLNSTKGIDDRINLKDLNDKGKEDVKERSEIGRDSEIKE